jgi:hypothetical protein
MPQGPSDTDPKAEAVQIELLRKATIAQRVSLAVSLSETVIRLSRRAIEQARPDLTEREQDLLWVELHYGAELAAKLREYMQRMDNERP